MEFSACHVVYLDRRAREDKYEESTMNRRLDTTSRSIPVESIAQSDLEVQENVQILLSCFHGVHVTKSGADCLGKIRSLDSTTASSTPVLVFADVALDPKDEQAYRSSFRLSRQQPVSPTSPQRPPSERLGSSSEDYYGLSFVSHVASEIKQTHLSKLVVLIALARLSVSSPLSVQMEAVSVSRPATDTSRILKCLEAGATDVIVGPLTQDRVHGLTIHAYRAYVDGSKQKPTFLAEKRMRKMSWVGVEEERPYAWLRETMVSSLMESICKPETTLVKLASDASYYIEPEREDMVNRAIASYNFVTHDFSDDELMHAGFLMLKHALQMPELEKWRLPDVELKNFLQACREAYNSFVLYHNFRHVIDVLQAVFYFLLQLGVLPRHEHHATAPAEGATKSPITALLRPFEAFVLLVAAIGHDVGHPGVNNAFLVALRAPLAQLYNDNSVLEAFHCAAYSQILRRYWNSAFKDTEVRRLLIKVILATDMQVHFKYMSDLGNLQEKLGHNKGTDGWAPQQLEEHKHLACGLLIKCADISNVSRPFDIAAKWAEILQQEFARQGEMEQRVQIPTTLFGGPPELGDIGKLAQSQIGFMNIFAYPLFEAVSDILPPMRFAVDQLKSNQEVWKAKIAALEAGKSGQSKAEIFESDGAQSPRSGSPDRSFSVQSPTLSHPEGLPASGEQAQNLPGLPMSASPEAPFNRPVTPPGNHIDPVGEAFSTPGQSAKELPQESPSLAVPARASQSESEYTSARSSGAFPNATTAKGKAYPSNQSNGMNAYKQPEGPTSSPNAPSLKRENAPPAFSTTIFKEKGTSSPLGPPLPPPPNNGSLPQGELGPTTPQRGGFDPDGSYSPAPFYGNFSRPLSARHSTQPSYARSSAPSGTPTFASNVMPNSPTETQATSLLTDSSDFGNGAAEKHDTERPNSGTSSGINTETTTTTGTSTIGSNGQSPMGPDTKSSSSIPRTVPEPIVNGHVEGSPVLRKKNSRFRLKFWNKNKRAGEATP